MTDIIDQKTADYIANYNKRYGPPVFRRERYTFEELAKQVGITYTPRPGYTPLIVYDPKVKPDYLLKRQQVHDGTTFFTGQMIYYAVLDFISQNTSSKKKGLPGPDQLIQYTLGQAKIVTVDNIVVPLKCGHYPGQRERLIIPVSYRFVPTSEVDPALAIHMALIADVLADKAPEGYWTEYKPELDFSERPT